MKSKVNDIALHKLMQSSRFEEKVALDCSQYIYADVGVVAAWHQGKCVYCQSIAHPLDQSHAIAEAQIELKRLGAFTDLENPDEVLKMPCLAL